MHVLAARVLLQPVDLDASVDFYEHRLGLTRYREWGDPPNRGIVYFLGGGYLELSETSPVNDPGPRPGGVRLWLQVADCHAACEELQRSGIRLVETPRRQPWGLIEARIADPDGLELVVVETPIDHPIRRRE